MIREDFLAQSRTGAKEEKVLAVAMGEEFKTPSRQERQGLRSENPKPKSSLVFLGGEKIEEFSTANLANLANQRRGHRLTPSSFCATLAPFFG